MNPSYSAIVVGGGFFGCALALRLARAGGRVLLVEAERELLSRASHNNQARVHNGYHYPRSFPTALRSHLNFQRFCQEYRDCIDDSYQMYYAVSRQFSQVTARSFWNFCRRVQAPIAAAPKSVAELFNPDLIEQVFEVTEHVFDAVRLRAMLVDGLARAGVEVCLDTCAQRVSPIGTSELAVDCLCAGDSRQFCGAQVFNCTYSQLNGLLERSGLPLIPLCHEWAEMALVAVPPALRSRGVTVMCGPFFSVMPFPSRGLHTLSHVRYTPHCAWRDTAGEPRPELVRHSAFRNMLRDAARYLPALGEAAYVDSLWEVKTIMPRNERDDGRPVLFKRDHGLANLHCVLGAKLDNVFDLLEEACDPQPSTPVIVCDTTVDERLCRKTYPGSVVE
jgi:glycine/D-amino acid oxidase-like deaminating enzyme